MHWLVEIYFFFLPDVITWPSHLIHLEKSTSEALFSCNHVTKNLGAMNLSG